MNVRPNISEPVRKRLGLNAIVDARVLLNDLAQAPELSSSIISHLTTAKTHLTDIADCATDLAFIDAYMLYIYHYMRINNLPGSELPSTENVLQNLKSLLPLDHQNNQADLPSLDIFHTKISEANEPIDAVTLAKAIYQDACARHLNIPYAAIKARLDNAKNSEEAVNATTDLCRLIDTHTDSSTSGDSIPSRIRDNVVSMYLETAKRLASLTAENEWSLADGLTIMGHAKTIIDRLNAMQANIDIAELQKLHVDVYTSSALTQLSKRIDNSLNDMSSLASALRELETYRRFFSASRASEFADIEATAKVAMLSLYASQIDALTQLITTNEAANSDEILGLLAAYQIYMAESKSVYATIRTPAERSAHADRLCEFIALLLQLHSNVSQTDYLSLFFGIMSSVQEQITAITGEQAVTSLASSQEIERVLPCLFVKTKCAYTMSCVTDNFEEYNSLLDTVEKTIKDYLSLISRSSTVAEAYSAHHQAALALLVNLNHNTHPVRRLNQLQAELTGALPAEIRIAKLKEIIHLHSSLAQAHKGLVNPPISLNRLYQNIGDAYITLHQAGDATAMASATQYYKQAVLANKSDQAMCEKLLAMLQAQLNKQRYTILAVSLRHDIAVFTALMNTQHLRASNDDHSNASTTSMALDSNIATPAQPNVGGVRF